MSYLLIMKAKQFIKKLREQGVSFDKKRGKGGHYLAFYQNKQATLPFHGNMDIGPVFIKKICKQLGIDPEEIL